ncbi:MAG: hypothetical protein KF878_18965 [Planctomycetes bacterium]|nr:hypothetical protein [Planctomycetota bacterium]
MKKLLAAVLLTAVVGLSGCGTIFQGTQPKGPAIFGGVRQDLAQFSHEQSHLGDMIFYCLDMPFSLAGDAVLLLFSAINELYEGGIEVLPRHPRTLGNPVYVTSLEADASPAGTDVAALRQP